MDYKIELIPITTTDIDRTKAFYEDVVGWPADQDQVVEEAGLRFATGAEHFASRPFVPKVPAAAE